MLTYSGTTTFLHAMQILTQLIMQEEAEAHFEQYSDDQVNLDYQDTIKTYLPNESEKLPTVQKSTVRN